MEQKALFHCFERDIQKKTGKNRLKIGNFAAHLKIHYI
jgi:hypothetical protein